MPWVQSHLEVPSDANKDAAQFPQSLENTWAEQSQVCPKSCLHVTPHCQTLKCFLQCLGLKELCAGRRKQVGKEKR